jgi:hypothetical protein
VTQILKTMTIQEAAALWSDPARIYLNKWIEDFNLPLEQLRMSHVDEYQMQRAHDVDPLQVRAEVATLRALLMEAGTGEEIHEVFLTPEERLALKPEELVALPERARAYIGHLEKRLEALESEGRLTKDKLRKANWAKWNRSG